MNKYLVVTLIIISGVLSVDKPLEIRLNKESYLTEDKFSAIVLNQSKEKITYFGLSIEEFKNGTWETIRFDTSCPCMAKCKKAPKHLEQDKQYIEYWDYKNNSCEVVTLGEYRAVIKGSNKKLNGVSNVFQIK